jgi:hypothetical protein
VGNLYLAVGVEWTQSLGAPSVLDNLNINFQLVVTHNYVCASVVDTPSNVLEI